VAANLDLTGLAPGPAPAAGRLGRLGPIVGVGSAGAGLAVVVAAATGWAALPLLGCVVAGMGVTYLSGLRLTLEERLAYGTAVGALALSIADFLLAMAFGMGLATVLAGLAVTLAVSAPGWWQGRTRLDGELREAIARWWRREPWPLWALLALCWPFTLVLLSRAYRYTDQGLIAGGPWVYADWAAHLTFAGSFAYGHNFPPQFPVDPGHRMAYPFLIDLLAASFVPLGTSLTSSLVLSSALLALAFPAVMYLAGVRLIASRGGAALAVLVFTLGGGLGFLSLAGSLWRSGLAAFSQPAPLYTQDIDHNYQWLNPVLAWMLPQRSVLFGFSLALLVMAVLWLALREPDTVREGPRAWAPFAFAGVVAGLAPLGHLHAYGTVVVLAVFWALLSPRPQWTAFFVPALALGLPAVLWMASGGAASIRAQPWWLANSAGHADGPLWFWLKNTGLLIPAMAAAFLWPRLMPAGLSVQLAPIWLWFLVPNFLVFQPWDWDNTKFFAYWALFGALPVGALLARLLRGAVPGRVVAYGLAVALMLSGALDLGRALNPAVTSSQFTDEGGVRVAAWARTHTDPTALFLVAPVHNHPIPTLAGRRVVIGYPGWLWTYGLADWSDRSRDAQDMLKGSPSTIDLLHRYGVGYVVLGPQDAAIQGSNAAYFDRVADRIYDSGGYTVYRVR